VVKSSAAAKADAAKALERSTKQWRAAKKKERAARDELAQLVQNTVDAEILSESKISQITDIPRMTIRKMLGKDAGAKKDD
jgi:DNA invertase Pin-like site-specific DNA recombinase